MKFPKISIVTPSYNQGNYLEETILSVIGQQYPNLEYIIIDGGSTDNSVEIIKKYESYITYWISENDNGIYEAIQKGFDRSTGEIMAWINSDDMYHKKALFTVAEIFRELPSVKWVLGNPTTFDEYGRTISTRPIRSWSKYNFYLDDYRWIQQESTFWRRELWQNAGNYINQKLRFAADFELWLRFFRQEQLYVTDALIGGFRIRLSNQLSLDHLDDYIREVQKCIQAEFISKTDQERITKIKSYEKLMKFTSRFNIGFLKTTYLSLFDYPDRIRFNRGTQKFELNKG